MNMVFEWLSLIVLPRENREAKRHSNASSDNADGSGTDVTFNVWESAT
jgi:hypothetical protein